MKKNRGFTLIELIVVIAVISVLSLLLMPQISAYTTEASAAVCQSNRQTLMREMLEYKINHDTADLTQCIDKVMTNHGAVKTSSLTYTKICPKSDTAVYTVVLSSDQSSISTITCSEHGGQGKTVYITPIEANLVSADASTVKGKYNSDTNLDKAFIAASGGSASTLTKSDPIWTELFGTDYASKWYGLPSTLEWHAKYITIDGTQKAVLYARAANNPRWCDYVAYVDGKYYVSRHTNGKGLYTNGYMTSFQSEMSSEAYYEVVTAEN